MGPSFMSMLVFGVRINGFLCTSKQCVYFSGLYLAARFALDLSFSLPRCDCLYRLEVFRNGVTLCPVQRSSCFISVSLWGVMY